MGGKTIAHYRSSEKFGKGGMRVIDKTRDRHPDRFVAIR